jgi:hypothetical protein
MPKANSEGMQQHLEVIAAAVTSGKHAVLVVDRAAWMSLQNCKYLPTYQSCRCHLIRQNSTLSNKYGSSYANQIGLIAASKTMTKLLMSVAKLGIGSPINLTPSELFARGCGRY